MISKVFILALVAPLVCATIVLQQPNDTVRTDSPITITWDSTDNADPPFFTIVLQRQSFHDTFAIANNVPTSEMSITLTIPTVPVGDGYALQAVNISNINDVYSQFGPFSVAPALSTSSGSTATSAAKSSVTLPPALTSSGLSTIGATTATGTVVSTSNLATSVPSTTTGTQTSANTASSTPFNNGAMQAGGSFTALALSALAGITFLAF